MSYLPFGTEVEKGRKSGQIDDDNRDNRHEKTQDNENEKMKRMESRLKNQRKSRGTPGN